MQCSKLGTLALFVGFTGCDGGADDFHPGHDRSELGDVPDAAEGGGCEGRGKPLSGVVLRPKDALVDAGLALVSAIPARPIVGNNSWVFALTVEGEPATGWASVFTVTPFMPDHGHGTPTIVRVEEVEPGQYKLEPVHTRMAGYWEVTVSVDVPAGELNFVVKVCVD
jgi:hypothetical protein